MPIASWPAFRPLQKRSRNAPENCVDLLPRPAPARPAPGSSPRRSVSAASGCGAPAQPVVDSAARIRSVTAAGWEPQAALELYTDAPTARWPSSYERGQPLLATGECPGGCTVALWPGRQSEAAAGAVRVRLQG